MPVWQSGFDKKGGSSKDNNNKANGAAKGAKGTAGAKGAGANGKSADDPTCWNPTTITYNSPETHIGYTKYINI